jgi:hypothetical protein
MAPCPWADWPQGPAAFCEASLCAWVRQPGNTWSNVGFLVAAAAIFAATGTDRRHRPMAWILVLMGLGSAFYHASETRTGHWLDWAGMLSMTAYMAAFCVGRATSLSAPGRRAVFAAVLALGLAPLAWSALPLRETFLALNLLCPAAEAYLALRPETRSPSYRWFVVAWAAFGAAFALWVLDERGILCDPDDHVVSGHAGWHLLDAAMFWASFRYYRQLPR